MPTGILSASLLLMSAGRAIAMQETPLVLSQPLEKTSASEPLAAQEPSFPPPAKKRSKRPTWAVGPPLMQGFIGMSAYSKVAVEDAQVDGDDGDVDRLPLIGGGGQWKLGGERVDLGIEALLSFAWRSDASAFVVGGSGGAIAIDVDLLVSEFYGGPFASIFLGDSTRLYAAAGPMLQFADYEQHGNGLGADGSGFGGGWYVRTGLEFILPSRTLLGIGARWSDSTVDLGGALGDLELEGLQGVITVSRGI